VCFKGPAKGLEGSFTKGSFSLLVVIPEPAARGPFKGPTGKRVPSLARPGMEQFMGGNPDLQVGVPALPKSVP